MHVETFITVRSKEKHPTDRAKILWKRSLDICYSNPNKKHRIDHDRTDGNLGLALERYMSGLQFK